MIKIKNFLADNWAVFFFVALGATLIFAVNAAANNNMKRNELCYARGMVVVNSDAGRYCANPLAMVKIEE
jgi:hypothetical protein